MRASDHGFTLVEVLIALVLFALIGIAGFSLLKAMTGVEARTGRRLERLAELQRAMHILTLDFEQQVADRPIAVDGSTAVLTRYGGEGEGGAVVVTYTLENETVVRSLTRAGRPAQRQRLLSRVDSLGWEFFTAAGGWAVSTPPPAANGVAVTGGGPGVGNLFGLLPARPVPPQAIAAVMTLSGADGGLSGVLRRVMALPIRLDR